MNPARARRALAVFSLPLGVAVAPAAATQEVRVQGIVRNEANQPVPFANIHVGGTRRGITDDSGHFE